MSEPLCPALSCNVEDGESESSTTASQEDNEPSCNSWFGCPREIGEVTIRSVTFTSDHGLLKDHEKDWEDGGVPFAKPEWTAERSHPISHTGGKPLSIKLEVVFGPPGAPSAEVKVSGTQPRPHVWFEHVLTVRPGTMVIELDSIVPLSEKVQDLDLELVWRFEGLFVKDQRTRHRIFVTMGRPSTPEYAPGITLKRMKHAVERASTAAATEPREIVAHVIQKFPQYNPTDDEANSWLLADRSGAADCQTIVRYAQNVIQMVGCPGKNDFTVVWAKITSPAKGEVTYGYTPCMDEPKQFFNEHFPQRPEWENVYGMLMDDHHVINRYEACLRFEHNGEVTFFGGGAGAYRSPEEVIRIFAAMVMVRDAPGGGELVGIWYKYS